MAGLETRPSIEKRLSQETVTTWISIMKDLAIELSQRNIMSLGFMGIW